MIAVQLLGGFRISVDGQSVPGLSAARQQALLATLVLSAEQAVGRQQLASLLWPDSSATQARTNLRRELHKLRHTHTRIDAALCVDQQSLVWSNSARFQCDYLTLSSMLDAVPKASCAEDRQRLCEGLLSFDDWQLLPALQDDWVLERRQRLHDRVIRTLNELGQAMLADGDHGRAIALAETVLRADDLCESAYLHLMHCHLARDDRVAALHAYRCCAAALKNELGIQPGACLNALYERLIADSSALQQVSQGRPVASSHERIVLIGRDVEWDVLRSQWAATRSDGARFLLIQGEAGIGKTCLAEKLIASVVDEHGRVASARSYAAEGKLAFSPVREWLLSEGLQSSLDGLDALWLSEIHRAFPEVAVGRAAQILSGEVGSGDRHHLFEALARAMQASGDPLLLFVDDLQWTDADTLEWLRFLFRFVPGMPVLVLATARIEELDDNKAALGLLDALADASQSSRLSLRALGPAESASLVALESPSAPVIGPTTLDAGAIYRRSEGNPLFIVELVRSALHEQEHGAFPGSSGAEYLPERVAALYRHRIASVSGGARGVIGSAAAIGREFSLALMAAVCEASGDDIADAFDELWRRRLIRESRSGDFEFTHDCIREAAYAELTPVRARQTHAKIARALTRIHDADWHAVSGEIASHYERAGQFEEAYTWFKRAAQTAFDHFACGEAKAHYLAAIRMLEAHNPDLDRLTDLRLRVTYCIALLEGFSGPEIRALCGVIEADLPLLTDEAVACRALARLRLMYSQTDIPRAVQLSAQMIELGARIEDPTFGAMAQQSMSFSQHQHGCFAASVRHGRIGWDYYQRHAEPTIRDPIFFEAHCLLSLGACCFSGALMGHSDKTRQLGDFYCNRVIEHLPVRFQLYIRLLRIQTLLMQHCWQRAERECEWLAWADRTHAFGFAQAMGCFFAGWGLLEQGQPRAAADALTDALGLADSNHTTIALSQRLGILAEAQLLADQPELARKNAYEGLRIARDGAQPYWNTELLRVDAMAMAAMNAEYPSVCKRFEQSLAVANEQGAGLLSMRTCAAFVRYLLDQRRFDAARKTLQALPASFEQGGDSAELRHIIELRMAISAE